MIWIFTFLDRLEIPLKARNVFFCGQRFQGVTKAAIICIHHFVPSKGNMNAIEIDKQTEQEEAGRLWQWNYIYSLQRAAGWRVFNHVQLFFWLDNLPSIASHWLSIMCNMFACLDLPTCPDTSCIEYDLFQARKQCIPMLKIYHKQHWFTMQYFGWCPQSCVLSHTSARGLRGRPDKQPHLFSARPDTYAVLGWDMCFIM